MSAGHPAAAVLDALDAAAGRYRNSADFTAVRACSLARMGSVTAALELLDDAMLGRLSLGALEAAGTALVAARRPDRAEPYFRSALALAPRSATLATNLAATLRFLGRVDEAEQLCERAIECSADAFDALKLRSDLRRQSAERNHVEQLRRRLQANDLPWRAEVQLAYALGKESEDLGCYDDAFAAFARGARVRRAHMNYDVREDVDVMNAISEVFADLPAEAAAGVDDPSPIFIVGLPRSGSTLLDRMLSRHPDVESLDEPQVFGMQVVRLVQGLQQRTATRQAFVAATRTIDAACLGNAYLAGVAALRRPLPRCIDKLPINFLYLGLIATALPRATLVHIRRDPLDAGMAMFKTLFDEAYPFSYSLADLGAYLVAYRQLMEHWSHVLGGRLLHVDYEKLVANPETILKRILARAGAHWDPRCLEPHLHPQPALTASTLQVREPPHARSVGSWRHYEKHLTPLRESLDC